MGLDIGVVFTTDDLVDICVGEELLRLSAGKFHLSWSDVGVLFGCLIVCVCVCLVLVLLVVRLLVLFFRPGDFA